MDLVLKRSGGANIVLRPMARATWYPDAVTDAVEVEFFKRTLNDNGGFTGAPISLGRYPSTGRVELDYNPVTDRNVRIYAIAYSADGTPDVSSLEDAVQVTALFQRETAAPTVTLIGAATNTRLELEVDGFTQFATKRRLRRSPNADMSGATETITDYTGQEMPRVVVIERAPTALAETIYVAISHSSGGAYGTESAPAAFTFTDAGGTGGSTGGGGGYHKRDPYDL